MRYKKFLLIPALVFFYLFFVVDLLAGFNPATVTSAGEGTSGGGVQTIGVGEAVSVSVTRQYLFGLLTLPVYTSGLGNIGGYHDAFFWSMAILAAAFVVIEWRGSAAGTPAYGRPGRMRNYGSEVMRMPKSSLGGIDAMAVLKAVGVGIAFGLVAWFLSVLLADTGATTALMLLVMYLEYKFRN